MKIYESKQEAISDNTSTAWTFTIVGIIGIVFLILNHSKFTPFSVIIMALMLFAFLLIGIVSFLSTKKIAKQYDKQQELISSVLSSFKEEKSEEFLTLSDGNEADLYFVRADFIEAYLTERFPEVDNKLTAYLIEQIYSTYFPEEDTEEEL